MTWSAHHAAFERGSHFKVSITSLLLSFVITLTMLPPYDILWTKSNRFMNLEQAPVFAADQLTYAWPSKSSSTGLINMARTSLS